MYKAERLSGYVVNRHRHGPSFKFGRFLCVVEFSLQCDFGDFTIQQLIPKYGD